MFKPNIRGVSKRGLKFGLTGWQIQGQDSRIEHRHPWRLSWIERVAVDSSLHPVLARSGQVYLICEGARSVKGTPVRTGAKKKILFTAVVAVCVFAGAMLVSPAQEKQAQHVSKYSAVAVDSCSVILQDPGELIGNWLAGEMSKEAVVTEEQQILLGGLQLRKIGISCGTQDQNFQLTLTQKGSSWQLKKFTRLEN